MQFLESLRIEIFKKSSTIAYEVLFVRKATSFFFIANLIKWSGVLTKALSEVAP